MYRNSKCTLTHLGVHDLIWFALMVPGFSLTSSLQFTAISRTPFGPYRLPRYVYIRTFLELLMPSAFATGAFRVFVLIVLVCVCVFFFFLGGGGWGLDSCPKLESHERVVAFLCWNHRFRSVLRLYYCCFSCLMFDLFVCLTFLRLNPR